VGVAQATVDLRYDTTYLTAQQIVHGPAFTMARTGVIDDAQGLVSAIGGQTALSNVGDDGYVLLARVKFASTGNDQVPVNEAGRNIGPYGMQMALARGQVVLVGGAEVAPELGASPSTELWAVMYDIDDNNQIDFGDLSFFAAAFGRTVGSTAEPPYLWWADFDKSGRVDFGDLSFFAPNFGRSRADVQSGAQTLIFPPNFPDAWRAGSGAGEGESESESEGESERERGSERESESERERQRSGLEAVGGWCPCSEQIQRFTARPQRCRGRWPGWSMKHIQRCRRNRRQVRLGE
jgi:hypothetical protein